MCGHVYVCYPRCHVCVVCVPVDCGVRVYAVELSSVTGDQGEGGCRRSIPDSGGGVRWSVFGVRRIGGVHC